MAGTFFIGATVLDGSRAPQPDMTVIVEGNRITAMGRRGSVPVPEAHDRVFDIDGMTLMPGLFQCHLHAAMHDIESYRELDMKYPANYLTLIAARNVERMLSFGFTSAVGAGSPANIDVVLRHAIEGGLIKGPRLYACSPHLITTGESLDYMPSFWQSGIRAGFGRVCDGAEEFRKAVRAEIKDGVDIVKVHASGGHGSNLSVECLPITFAELQAAADAAHERGKKIRAHAAGKAGIMMCVRAGVDLIDHVDFFDDECIEAFLKHDISITPGAFILARALKLLEAFEKQPAGAGSGTTDRMSSPFFNSMRMDKSEFQRALDQFRLLLPKALRAGVNIINGDDFGGTIAPHGTYADELVSYVEDVGIAAQDVIAWATRNPGRFVGQGELGVVAEGKLADLLVVRGNPATDITVLQQKDNFQAVMKDGQFIECRLESCNRTADRTAAGITALRRA
jgi:imidazolonepropionase-like amidohydrolase